MERETGGGWGDKAKIRVAVLPFEQRIRVVSYCFVRRIKGLVRKVGDIDEKAATFQHKMKTHAGDNLGRRAFAAALRNEKHELAITRARS